MVVLSEVAGFRELVRADVATSPSLLMRLRGFRRGLSSQRYRMPAPFYDVSVPHQQLRGAHAWRPTEFVHVLASHEPSDDLLEARALTRQKGKTHTLLPRVGDNARAVVASGDYRLAVVLAADTVAYTRRMAKDEAGMHASCMAVYRDIIAPEIVHHGARISKRCGADALRRVVGGVEHSKDRS